MFTYTHQEKAMRTNIILDDQLVTEALQLSGKKTKKEVVNFALQKLVQSLRKQPRKYNQFVNNYINTTIKLKHFTPINRNDLGCQNNASNYT